MKYLPLLILPIALYAAPAATKAEMLRAVEEQWRVASGALPAAASASNAPAVGLREELRRWELPEVTIVRLPLSQALESLTVGLPAEEVLNFVVTGGNDPEVSLALRNTTMAAAIDLLTESVGMAYELRERTVVVMPQGVVGTLRTEYFPLSQGQLTRLLGAEAVKAVAAPGEATSASALYTRSSAEAALRAFFERVGIVWVEGSGMALGSGELIVTHNARALERIADLLGRTPKSRQVEIEAKFMEVGEGALEELGVQWSLTNASGRSRVGSTDAVGATTDTLRTAAGAFGNTTASSSTLAVAPTIPGGVNLAAQATKFADVTGILGDYQLRNVISALSQKDGSELLSAPRVTVLSGSTAAITVAQEMRYPQSYDRVNTDVGSGTSSGSIITAPTPLDFTTRNIGVEMQVTPYVEEDGSITLILQPQVTQFERFVDYGGQSVVVNNGVTQTLPSGFFQPVFSVRRVNTEVNIPSGQTVLLGGLTREETVQVRDKVPILGSLPLIGRAFRSNSSSTLKKNLVIFVTARLVE
jgi:general secretion pathway protein D